MGRSYHRKIRLTAQGDAERPLVIGELADDPHHFRVRLRHDGAKVLDIEGEAVRHPWSTCPEAMAPIRALIGMPLSQDATAIGAVTPANRNCTHLYDLAGLAVAHAASGRAQRLYHAVVSGDARDATHATLDRDGARMLDWQIRGELAQSTLVGPPPFGGTPLYGGFMAWAHENLSPDLAEAAIVLRRACMIGSVRHQDLDQLSHAPQAMQVRGQCYTYTEGVAERATRMVGSRKDFTTSSETLLDPVT